MLFFTDFSIGYTPTEGVGRSEGEVVQPMKSELIKRHFAEVLMDMCETRRLDDVTVVELVAEAGMARQTFYNHFTDINDLICYTAR